MSLYQGATTIDAVYFGRTTVPVGQVSFMGATGANAGGTATPPTNVEGDLIVFHVAVASTNPIATPAGFTLWKTMTHDEPSGSSNVSDNCSMIIYRFAPAGGQGAVSLSGAAGWACYVYRNANTTAPFGAYAQNKTVGDSFGTKPVAPGITMTNTSGNALAVHMYTVMIPGSFSTGPSFPSSCTTYYLPNNSWTAGCGRNDRTTAGVGSLEMGTGSVDGAFGFTYEILPGEKAISPLAQAVYLGTEKVWPIYVATLSPWYSPSVGSPPGGGITVPWPFGAEFCDAIVVSGGAGGTGTGVAGNDQRGGGEGVWAGKTFSRIAYPATPYTGLNINNGAKAGADGAGGGNFNTEAADGSAITIFPIHSPTQTSFTGWTTAGGLDKTSNSGNRNGGNVAPTFTFNGRTYTLASYGAGAGQGGASSNKNGGPGARPGGGGQSADDGGLTGYNGGAGAHGAAILYWY